MDGDEEFRDRLAELLRRRGYVVFTAGSPEDVSPFGPVEVDVVLAGQSVLEGHDKIFDALSYLKPPPEVILMLTFGSIQSAIAGMKKGVFDDIYVPFEISELEDKIVKAYNARREKARRLKRKSLKQKLEDIFVRATFAEANVELPEGRKKKTRQRE